MTTFSLNPAQVNDPPEESIDALTLPSSAPITNSEELQLCSSPYCVTLLSRWKEIAAACIPYYDAEHALASESPEFNRIRSMTHDDVVLVSGKLTYIVRLSMIDFLETLTEGGERDEVSLNITRSICERLGIPTTVQNVRAQLRRSIEELILDRRSNLILTGPVSRIGNVLQPHVAFDGKTGKLVIIDGHSLDADSVASLNDSAAGVVRDVFNKILSNGQDV